MSLSLSLAEARKLVINSQRVLQVERKGKSIDATLRAIEHLGYIQIDTISVVARAHHHTLWSRNPRYKSTQLEELLAERKIFEFWSHAAAYLPMKDYRFALPRMEQEKNAAGHWHVKNAKLMRQVLKRIRDEGPLGARDFEDTGPKRAIWERKPAKYALEQLFMEGEVMTSYRQGFQKVYDLTERVLPTDVDTRLPTVDEYARFLINRFLNAHGLGKPAEFSHLRRGFKAAIVDQAKAMLEQGDLVEVKAAGEKWLMLPDALAGLDQPLAKSRVRILSPFDNLVILRKRVKAIFAFDYQIECYLPEEKRLYGYFSLPVMWQGKLVARMDCKAHRNKSLFELRHLGLEAGLKNKDAFCIALKKELAGFCRFNECDQVQIKRVTQDGVTCASSKSLLSELVAEQ